MTDERDRPGALAPAACNSPPGGEVAALHVQEEGGANLQRHVLSDVEEDSARVRQSAIVRGINAVVGKRWAFEGRSLLSLVALYGFVVELRPSEPFLTPYLVDNKSFSNEEVRSSLASRLSARPAPTTISRR